MAAATVRTRPTAPEIPPAALTNDKPPRRSVRTTPQVVPEAEPEELEAPTVQKPEDGDDFWNMLTAFTSDDWANIICYLYRTDPKINRRNGGRPINLQKYSECIDSERVKLDHGSGGYLIMVNRRNPRSGKYDRIASLYFDVFDMNYPPRVPLGDWIDEPVNDAWKWAKPGLETAATATAHAAQYPPQADPNEQVRTILDAAKTFASQASHGDREESATVKVLDAVLKRSDKLEEQLRSANDPRAMLELIKELLPKQQTGETVMEKFLMMQLASLQARIDAVSATPQKGLLEQITEILPALAQIQELFPGAAGAVAAKAVGTDWGGVVTGVVEKLADNIPTIALMFAGNAAKNGTDPTNGFKLTPPTATAPPAAAAPAASTTASSPQTGGAAPVPNQDQPQATAAGGPPPEVAAHYHAVLTKWGPMINDAARIMIDFALNDTGYDFRDWLIARKGTDIYNQFTSDTNAEALTGMIQLHTVLKSVMPPPEKTLIFFQEFFTPVGQEPEGALVDDDEPEPNKAATPVTPASATVINARKVK